MDKGKFQPHYDWFPSHVESLKFSGNRLSSIFVYLLADCAGGNTEFPMINRPSAEQWCGTLQCRDDKGQEVKWVEVIPKVGTAIFWYNLQPDGAVDVNTMHAGAPITNGTKAGLNIWTRERGWRKRNIQRQRKVR